MDIPWEKTEVVWTEPAGAYTIQRVTTEWDYGLEGYFLAHCLGTKDVPRFERIHKVYSLRDKLGIPHCTILCASAQQWSEYGNSADLGTVETFWPEGFDGPELNVLQVRGRCDAIAMLPYHQLVREWYEAKGGKLTMPDADLNRAVIRMGDDDYAYHFQYKLDESVNVFNWAYRNVHRREAAQRDGTSK
jgi:hypothetical protein